MLWYVLRACYEAGCAKVMVVVGHGKDEVIATFADDKRITWIEQDQQLGTGHAALACADHLKNYQGDVFILGADAPLVRGEALRTLLAAHHEDRAVASMATSIMDNPSGWARIIRDAKGDFVSIISEAEATEQQRTIREIFPSYYCVNSKDLCHALAKLTNATSNHEYNLVDIYKVLKAETKHIAAVQAVAPEDTFSVNTRHHLAEVDLIMQDRIHRQLRDSGVTIVSGFNTYVEIDASIGRDTVVHPFTFIGRDATIGADCVIGPFARIPRDSVVPEGTSVLGHPPQDTISKI